MVLWMPACQFDPFASEFTRVRPVERYLVGRYVPDAETRERLASQLNVKVPTTCELLVGQDGRFVVHDAPNCWFGPAVDCAPEDVDFTGDWRLGQHQKWWAVQLTARTINGKPGAYGLPAMIRGDEPPYILHLTIGDPDSGNALAFELAEQSERRAKHELRR
jgi:hypothetical protein